MLIAIILISLALAWLGIETKWFTIRLPVGKDKPRNAGRTMAEWDIYNKEHAKELEQEQKEYARKQAERASHTCNICQKYDETMTVETREIKAGNSICHVKGCPECIAKFTKDIENSQTAPIRQPAFKPFTSLLCDGNIEPLCGKAWLKEHENFEYPEPTIEISINGKDLHVNGNYKKGLIGDFVSQYTTRVKAGKKTVTVVNEKGT